MLFLVELDCIKSGQPLKPEAGRAFIEQIIQPTLARAEQLAKEKKILAGGPVVGRIALRFAYRRTHCTDANRIISRLPIWPPAESRVTPLIAFADRRNCVHALLERLVSNERNHHGRT